MLGLRSLPVMLIMLGPAIGDFSGEDGRSCTESEAYCHQEVSLLQQGFRLQHGQESDGSASLEGHDTSISPMPPLLYLKTPKTGSSTMASIINRLGERRNMRFMLPFNNRTLGFPGPFPGTRNILHLGQPEHQFQVICHHAVYNRHGMFGYLAEKPNPLVLTTLRKPLDRDISGFNWLRSFDPVGKFSSWDAFLTELEMNPPRDMRLIGDNRNAQARYLGWYDFVGGSIKYDHDQGKIHEWLATLDNDKIFAVLLEHFDQGLVLWQQSVPLELEELSYIIFKEATDMEVEKIYPNETEVQRLRKLITVDEALYEHFNQSFWKLWSSYNTTKLDTDVAKLKSLNQKLQEACDAGDRERCTRQVTMDHPDYTVYFKETYPQYYSESWQNSGSWRRAKHRVSVGSH